MTGSPDNDIIVADGTAPELHGNTGDDLIAAGSGESRIFPGSGNNTVWGGEYPGTGDGYRDTFAFQAGDSGQTDIQDFEPGVDVIDLSTLLNLESVWSSSDLATQVTIDETDGNTRITAQSEVISLDTVPLETLLPEGTAMEPAQRLSTLVEQGDLIVSNQYGHEGKDTLYRMKEDAGNQTTPYKDQVINFHEEEDIIDISALPYRRSYKHSYDCPFTYSDLPNHCPGYDTMWFWSATAALDDDIRK